MPPISQQRGRPGPARQGCLEIGEALWLLCRHKVTRPSAGEDGKAVRRGYSYGMPSTPQFDLPYGAIQFARLITSGLPAGRSRSNVGDWVLSSPYSQARAQEHGCRLFHSSGKRPGHNGRLCAGLPIVQFSKTVGKRGMAWRGGFAKGSSYGPVERGASATGCLEIGEALWLLCRHKVTRPSAGEDGKAVRRGHLYGILPSQALKTRL